MNPGENLSMQDDLRSELEAHLNGEMERLLDTIPFARKFHEGTATDREYYARHMLEAALRITLNNEADAYCLHRIAYQRPSVAQTLATYLAEEYGHDELILQDLAELGVNRETARGVEPFFSTKLLVGYLYYSINRDGALPSLLWNWFVEWYSDKYNQRITCKAQSEFGSDKVKSTLAHLQIDDDLYHANRLFTAIEHIIKNGPSSDAAKQYLTNFVKLVGMYFQELYDTTLAKRSLARDEGSGVGLPRSAFL